MNPRVRARASEKPPPRNTRAHPHGLSAPPTDRGHQITDEPRAPFQVHWFTGVAELSAGDTFAHVHDITGASLLALRFGRMGYKTAFQAVELPGLMVLCDPGDPDNMPPVCVVVPGEACEALGWQRLQALSAPFKPTRVDLAFDDFPFSPAEVKSLIRAGSVRSRAQRHTLKWYEDDSNGVGLGETVTFGGRASSAFLRCYNSRGFNRGELELKGPRAEAAYELLQSPLDLAREMAISFMRAFVDFVDPLSSSNKSRQAPLSRWLFWYLKVQKAIVELPPRPVQTLERVWTWFDKQLVSMVAVLSESNSSRFDAALVGARDRRWTAKHRLLLGSA